MNNEFKKINNNNITRYVLEDGSSGGATSGGTSAGSISSFEKPMGGIQRRAGDDLIHQENKKSYKISHKPKNPVAKAHQTVGTGSGAHADKTKTIPRKEKHKKPADMTMENFNAEYDDEAGMADNNLETMKRAVDGLDSLIHKGDNLPEWCQEKIAVAKSMLVAVWDYMQSEEQGIAEGWKDESSEHDEFLAHARQQLQNATPVERIRLAQRLSKLEQKHFPEMSSIESNGISSSITGMLHSITDAKPRPNQQFGNVTTPQGSGSAEPLRPAPIQNKPSGATTSFAEPDDDEPEQDHDFASWYQSASDKDKAEFQQHIADKADMTPEEAKEYIEYMVKHGKISPEEWKEMKATELGEKITVVNDPEKATGIQNTGGITHGSVYSPGKPMPQTLQQKLDDKPNTDRAVDAKGRTQAQWIKLVKAKFPTARIIQAKIIDGPCQATLPDGRKLSWNKVEQDATETTLGDTTKCKTCGTPYNQHFRFDANGKILSSLVRHPAMKDDFPGMDGMQRRTNEDTYLESLNAKLAEKLDPNAEPEVWVQDFQKANPNKYHQFKNKTPQKKAQMAVAARRDARLKK